MPLFGKHGHFREGQKDLRLSAPSAPAIATTSASTENFQRLAKLTKKYHSGKISQVDWLDRLTFAEIERINQKEKLGSNQLFLMIEFPQVSGEQKRAHAASVALPDGWSTLNTGRGRVQQHAKVSRIHPSVRNPLLRRFTQGKT